MIKTGVQVDARLIRDGGYDVAVVATGSTWDMAGFTPVRPGRPGIPGLETHPRVLSVAEAALSLPAGAPGLGGNVLIVDETGAYLPLGVAEGLLRQGASVTVVSRRNTVGEIPRETWEFPLFMQRTKDQPLTLHANTLVERVDGRTVELRNLWGAPVSTDVFDAVVLSGLRYSRSSLAEELDGSGIETLVIGDARAPRRTQDAIYEGEKFARSV